MNRLGLLVWFGLVWMPRLGTAGEEKSTQELILKELKALRGELAEVKAKLDALEKKIEKIAATKKNDPPKLQKLVREKPDFKSLIDDLEQKLEDLTNSKPSAPDGFVRRGPDRKKLREIKLPENPDKAQVEEYVDKIAEASARQNSFSSDDIQIRMYAKLDRKWLPVLVEAAAGLHHMNNYHLNHAIGILATEDDRALILDALVQNHELVNIVLKHGWEKEAKKTLLSVLRRRPQYLPTEWIRAVAQLEDPAAYDDLTEFMATGSSPTQTYKAIKHLPGIKLEDAVARAWRRVKRDSGRFPNDWSKGEMAKIAVRYGRLDALETLVSKLGDKTSWHFEDSPRSIILKHTPARGTNEDIKAWFEKNKGRLEFDGETKKFVVSEKEKERMKV